MVACVLPTVDYSIAEQPSMPRRVLQSGDVQWPPTYGGGTVTLNRTNPLRKHSLSLEKMGSHLYKAVRRWGMKSREQTRHCPQSTLRTQKPRGSNQLFPDPFHHRHFGVGMVSYSCLGCLNQDHGALPWIELIMFGARSVSSCPRPHSIIGASLLRLRVRHSGTMTSRRSAAISRSWTVNVKLRNGVLV